MLSFGNFNVGCGTQQDKLFNLLVGIQIISHTRRFALVCILIVIILNKFRVGVVIRHAQIIDNRSRDRQGSGEIIAITTESNKFISTVSAL